MHKFVGLAAIAAFALTGCGTSNEPSAATTEEQGPSPTGTSMMAPDGLPFYGVFAVTSLDGGSKMMRNIKDDGTLIDVVPSSDPVPGTWTIDAEGNFCLTRQDETEPSCYANVMSDGTWTAIDVADPARGWTVKRVMGTQVLPTEAAG